jgi:hypothetical protein
MLAEVLQVGPSDIAAAAAALRLTPTEAALLRADHPFLRFGDWRMFAELDAGNVVARMVASVDARQRTAAGDVGCIGFVHLPTDAPAAAATMRSAERLLESVIGWLRARGVAVVRCPVQLATPYGHRAIVGGYPDEGGAPTFLLEPRDGRPLVDLLLSRGFDPVHRAVSCAVRPDAVIASARAAVKRLRGSGWQDRALDATRLDVDLALIHRLSLAAFRESWGFSEISMAEFRALYEPAARRANLELVRIAYDREDRALGFAFAVPDAPATGEPTLIVKTLAVLPEASRRYPGAGAGLAAMLHEAATGLGFSRGIHALMTRNSMAHRISLRWGTQIREYATFERALR